MNSSGWKTYYKCVRVLETILSTIIAILFFSIVFCTLLQVFARFVLNNSLLWPEEYSRYVGIMMVTLATGITLRKKRHISITYFAEKLPQKCFRVVEVLVAVIITVIFALLSVYSYQYMTANTIAKSAALGWPMWCIYGVVFIGMVLATVFSCLSLIEMIANKSQGEVETT